MDVFKRDKPLSAKHIYKIAVTKILK